MILVTGATGFVGQNIMELCDGTVACPSLRTATEDDIKGIIDRYGGRIGQNKAREILQAVRHCCNGGKLNSCSLVLRSELEYWESIVDKKFLARL